MPFLHGHTHPRRREKSHRWRGGRRKKADGYILTYLPEHPRARSGYVYEHVVIVERAMGKPLPKSAEVHHVDEDKGNNAHGNLVVCQDHAYHFLLHKRARALAACGDANAHRCVICHQYDRQDEITVSGKHRNAYHRSCAAELSRKKATGRAG